jgi:hypothetical protein
VPTSTFKTFVFENVVITLWILCGFSRHIIRRIVIWRSFSREVHLLTLCCRSIKLGHLAGLLTRIEMDGLWKGCMQGEHGKAGLSFTGKRNWDEVMIYILLILQRSIDLQGL